MKQELANKNSILTREAGGGRSVFVCAWISLACSLPGRMSHSSYVYRCPVAASHIVTACSASLCVIVRRHSFSTATP